MPAKFSLQLVLTLLLILTILSAGLVHYWQHATFAIMLLAGAKFYLVAFWFMELRKSHSFWKGCIILYIVLIVLLSQFI